MNHQQEMFSISAVEMPAPWVDPQKIASIDCERTTDTDYVNEAAEVGRFGNNREVFVIKAVGHDGETVKHWVKVREFDALTLAESLWTTLQRNRQQRLAI